MDRVFVDRAALDQLLDVVGGDPASLCELLDSFATEGPLLLRQLELGCAEGGTEALRRASHTLKSTARDFGATELSRLCAELEQQCRNGELCEPAAQVGAISAELAAVLAALAQIRAHGGVVD